MDQACEAKTKWTPVQRALCIGLILGAVSLLALDLRVGLWAGSLLLLGLYALVVGCKVLATVCGLRDRFTIVVEAEAYASLDDADLPVYTILLPMYRESRVAERLIANIGRLDYPADKLDVKILLEADDDETLGALRAAGIPPWAEVVIVPDLGPRTKPRACNAGLERARGAFAVIYDAEDRPEPDQLKKAVAAFAEQGDEVVCLQAKLSIYNASESWLSRCFALEYACWFDLYLPGLHAIACPIPLGGTSNHFRCAALRQLGGWDPYNVTEDCDLGLRIARAGWATRIIDSDTWEEAPCRVRAWIGQRSRWIKGYVQTFWVHTRRPWAVARELGPWRMLQLLLAVGGQVAACLLAPICWSILALWCWLGWPLFSEHAPATLTLFAASIALLLSNGLFLVVHAIAAVRRRGWPLLLALPALPAYWALLSVGAWRGAGEFLWKPFRWVKTDHGLSSVDQDAVLGALAVRDPGGGDGPRPPAYRPPRFRRGRVNDWLAVALVLLISVLIAAAGLAAPVALGWTAKVQQARIELAGPHLEAERAVPHASSDWTGAAAVELDLTCRTPEGAWDQAAMGIADARLMVFVKVRDGEWFHQVVDDFRITPRGIALRVDLAGSWGSPIGVAAWSPDHLRRVRSIGVKLFAGARPIAEVAVDTYRLVPITDDAAPPPLLVVDAEGDDRLAHYELFEARWDLTRRYADPFDPGRIACDGIVVQPDGSELTVPAFYAQDYLQTRTDEGEALQPTGAPYWALRFAPTQVGEHRWRIRAVDGSGDRAESPERRFRVDDREHPGHVTLGEDPRYFAFEDGSHLYPLAINIRSPGETINRDHFTFPHPDPRDGTYVMLEYIDRMKAAGITMGRVWMSPWFGGLEWDASVPGYHGLGSYNLRNAWRLDAIMQHAQRQGILIELALHHHGPFTERYDSQWADNPYNRANGGPAAAPSDILTDPAVADLFRRRLRYVVARYGAYANLFAYMLWVEANVVDPRPAVLEAWHRDFARYLRELDNGRHLVTTEFNNNGYPGVWRLDDIGYTQVAAYNHGGGLLDAMSDIARHLKPYRKPAIVEEYMGMPAGGSMRWLAHEFHDGFWMAWMLPLGGAPMPWWWNFIFEQELHRYYRVFGAFIAGEDLSRHRWVHREELPLEGGAGLRAMGRFARDRAYLWIAPEAVANLRFAGPYQRRREAADAAYERAVGPDFDPIAALRGESDAGFIAVDAAAVRIPAGVMEPGAYTVEWWDTWRPGEPERSEIQIDTFPYRLALPPLRRDVAIKLIAR